MYIKMWMEVDAVHLQAEYISAGKSATYGQSHNKHPAQ